MTMRISFDFFVSGFTIGCSISRDNFSLTSGGNSLPQGISLLPTQSVLVSIITLILSILAFRCWRGSRYDAMSYTVPVPKQCSKEWDGEVLENPSIRVCDVPCFWC